MTKPYVSLPPISSGDVIGGDRTLAPDSGRRAASLRSFRLLFELGRGGMARVYLGESLGSGIQKLVVLKILNHELARDAAMRAAFLREAVISGRMNHPNVVQVHEVLQHRSTDVIVMEYVDGFPLSRIVQERGQMLGVRLHVSAVVQMLAGLHYFHELSDLEGDALHGVHRDVSPHNVLVSHDGQVKVADFGIAKINAPVQHATQAGLVKGKVHYMAPEQLIGEEVDRRADIFSAGVLLWEAVAERRLWLGRDMRSVMSALVSGEIPSLASAAPNAPRALVEVVTRATAANPKDRYATALEMLEAAERAMSETGGLAPQRELAGFMSRAFGEIRAIQGRSVNDVLRRPELAPLGMLDCWTAGHAVQRPVPLQLEAERVAVDTSAALSNDFTSNSFYGRELHSTGGILNPSLSGLTAAGPTVLEPASPAKPARMARKALMALGAAALLLSAAAWLLPRPSAGAIRAATQPASAAQSAEAPSREPAPAPPVWEHGSARTKRAPFDPDRGFEPIEDVRPRYSPPRGAPRVRSAPPASGTPAQDCSPPYRLLPNGVKSFIPGCFPNAGAESSESAGPRSDRK